MCEGTLEPSSEAAIPCRMAPNLSAIHFCLGFDYVYVETPQYEPRCKVRVYAKSGNSQYETWRVPVLPSDGVMGRGWGGFRRGQFGRTMVI